MSNARLEFWHADAFGKYHMRDYKLRGVAWTSQDGRFLVNTIMPGYAGQIRHIKFLATAYSPKRKQGLTLCAAIFFATEEELSRPVAAADRPYVIPGATLYRDDPAFLPLSAIPVEDGLRRAAYDIVFDVE
jgi:hypothetical protein